MSEAAACPTTRHDLLTYDWSGVFADMGSDPHRTIFVSSFPSRDYVGHVNYEVMHGERKYRPRHPRPVFLALKEIQNSVRARVANADLTAFHWRRTTARPREFDDEDAAHRQTTSVYFIQADARGLVKIGMSRNPWRCLASLQTSCPVDLRLVKQINDVPWATKRELHAHFHRYRVRGEWFDPIVLTLEIQQ